MDTDIALTTLTGRDGLTVFARSIASAQPLPEHEVVLLSRGNEPIGKAVTGADGRATFPAGLLRGRGAAEATSIMVTDANKQEFSRLELTKAAFDLSDRGIDGRALPGPVDAFLYTERGVYRPGETVQLMAMLRDDSAVALKDMPVTLIVKRPDGSEFTRYTAALPGSGALHQAIDLPKSSRRGLWSVAAYIDPKAAPVGRVEFSVEDFVPEKLKVELSTEASVLRTGKTTNFDLSADFLYGAPASGLTVESDLRITVDPNPFPAFAKYSFGSEEARKNFEPPLITLDGPETDDKGKSRIEWAGDQVKDTDLAAARPDHRARLRARQRPRHQDRQVAAVAHPRRLSRRQPDLRGPLCPGRHRHRLRPRRRSMPTASRSPTRSTIRSCASPTITSGTRATAAGAGRARPREREVDAGTLALKADAPVNLSKRLQWGPHRLTVTDKRANTSTTVTFYVGWYGGSSGAEDAPDTLKVASDREKYAPGDTAKLRIEAPFAGEAVVTIATDRVLATYSTQVAGRRHDHRHPGQGRMGRRRLCAGHRLAPARLARRAHAGARDRRGLARPRSRAAHARRADRRAREGDAAPAHRGAAARRQRPGHGGLCHPGRGRRGHPAAHALQDAPAGRLLLRQAPARHRRCATTTAACSTPGPTSSARSAPAATPATSAGSTSCRPAPWRCSAAR